MPPADPDARHGGPDLARNGSHTIRPRGPKPHHPARKVLNSCPDCAFGRSTFQPRAPSAARLGCYCRGCNENVPVCRPSIANGDDPYSTDDLRRLVSKPNPSGADVTPNARALHSTVRSGSLEIAHSCSLRLKELHRVDEPRQFCCIDGNSTLGRIDLCRRGIMCSLKLLDAIDSCVERGQLLR